MKRKTPEDRYTDNVRKQQRTLVRFAEQEIEYSKYLLYWYSQKQDMPDDEYRACAFFQNKEYLRKPGSLTLLYEASIKCHKDMPEVTKENAFDILRFRYRLYAKTLEKAGFSGFLHDQNSDKE